MGNDQSTLAALAALAEQAGAGGGGNATVRLRDNYRSTDIDDDGTTVRCNVSVTATNITHQKMGADGSRVVIKLKVRRRAGGIVALGVVGTEANLDKCANNAVGTAEIQPSLGCGIRNNEVFVMHRGKPIFAGNCDTSDPTMITMIMENGKLSFNIDGRGFDCDELESLRMTGSFHIGVTTTTAGQIAEIVSVTTGGGKTASGSIGKQITFRDQFRSTNVDGHQISCVASQRATNITEQKMTTDEHRVTVKLRVSKLAGGIVAIGVVGAAADRNSLGQHIVGEKEITPSLGCGICDDEVFIVHKDKVLFRGACNTSDPTMMTMIMENGKLTFMIDKGTVNCSELKDLTLNGSFHIGVSTTKAGQVVRLESVDVGGSEGGSTNSSSSPSSTPTTRTSTQKEPYGSLPPPKMALGGVFTLWVPETLGMASLSNGEAISRAPGDVVVTNERFAIGLHRGVICDMCFAGIRYDESDDPEPLLGNRWKCSVSDDYDVCDACYANKGKWHHSVEKDKFRVFPGGVFFECRFEVEADGSPFVIALIPADKLSRFPHGVDSEFTVTPSARGMVPVAVRLLKGKVVFLAHGKIVHTSPAPAAPAYRFGVRFTEPSQRVKIGFPATVPPRGTEVKVTSDFALLKAEAEAVPVSLRVDESMAGLSGHALHTDEDGTLKMQTRGGRKLWLPIGAVTVIADRVAPVFGKLTEGMTVVRNPLTWRWGKQDRQSPGTVVEETSSTGWVRVRWSSGDTNSYRFGAENSYDVVPLPSEGDTVVRNPAFWKSGDEDGGIGTPGRVVSRDGGSVKVKWRGNTSTSKHKFNMCEHEVWLAPPGSWNAGAHVDPVSNNNSSTVSQSSNNNSSNNASGATVAPVPTAPAVPSPATPKTPASPPSTTTTQTGSSSPKRLKSEKTSDDGEDPQFLSPIAGVEQAADLSLADAIAADPLLKAANLNAVAFIARQAVMAKFKSKPIPGGMTVEQAASLHAFTQESPLYRLQGEALRLPDRNRLKSMFPLLKLQFGAMRKLERPTRPITVYRGIPDDVSASYDPESMRFWWSITSTSSSMKTMEEFATAEGKKGTLFVIEAYDLVNVTPFTAFTDEEEHFLFPGSFLRVKHLMDTGKYWIVQLEQVPAPSMVDMLPPHSVFGQ